MARAVSARLRERIVRFDPGVEGVSVREFCRVEGVSTSTFYRVRQVAAEEGLAAALVPRSRAPIVPARKYGAYTVAAIRQAHQALIVEGKDAGPWSVEWRLFQHQVSPLPSRSTIARIMRTEGLSQPTRNKRPHAAWHRFRRAQANELWQLDGIEWYLPDGQRVTIYQIIDDHSRLCPAILALAGGESGQGARKVLQAGIDAFGPPQSVLSDNGDAFNSHRRGRLSVTEKWLAQQGIRPISGRVAHPQTQGKVERSHQPVHKWLAAQAPTTLDELNTSLGCFQAWYNNERQHQGLGVRLTPMHVWSHAAKAVPEPHPIPHDLLYRQPLRQPDPPHTHRVADRRVSFNQMLSWQGYLIYFGTDMANTTLHIIQDDYTVDFFDDNGELHASLPWPPATPKTTQLTAAIPPFRIAPVHDRRRDPHPKNRHKLSQKS